jgi:uncharacterized protein YceK
MKNLLIGFLIILGSLFVVHGCSSISQNMNSAQRLYSSKCASCHILIEPCAFDEKTWEVYVHKYGEHMTEEEKQFLLDYLTDPNEAYW